MKNLILIIVILFAVNMMYSCKVSKSHKHPSYKKTKVKKSKYFYNFQH